MFSYEEKVMLTNALTPAQAAVTRLALLTDATGQVATATADMADAVCVQANLEAAIMRVNGAIEMRQQREKDVRRKEQDRRARSERRASPQQVGTQLLAQLVDSPDRNITHLVDNAVPDELREALLTAVALIRNGVPKAQAGLPREELEPITDAEALAAMPGVPDA